MTITREINTYLRSEDFRRDLLEQYERFEILAEGALRTAVANLLRQKLTIMGPAADKYRVTCETRLQETNIAPDVLLWKGKHPRIWIELKDTRRFEKSKAEADWAKLMKHCPHYPSIKAGYLVYVARIDGSGFAIKRDRTTLKYWPISIALDQHIKKFEKWNDQYENRAHYTAGSQKARAAAAK